MTRPLIDAVENAEALDGIGKAAGKQVRSLVKQPVKDALAGTWLGHALHPMLTDVVIGTFLSATLLDVVGGDEDGEAGAKLIGIGMAAYLPTALSGVNDWADTEPVDDGIRRAGLVHAWSNATALALYALSRKARRNGNRGRARALSVAGASALGAAGFLGGHLTFTKGVGPDQTVFDPGPDEWTEARRGAGAAGRPASSSTTRRCCSCARTVRSTRSTTAARTAAARSPTASWTGSRSSARATARASTCATARSSRARRPRRNPRSRPASATGKIEIRRTG